MLGMQGDGEVDRARKRRDYLTNPSLRQKGQFSRVPALCTMRPCLPDHCVRLKPSIAGQIINICPGSIPSDLWGEAGF